VILDLQRSGLLDEAIEHLEGLIEPLLAATIGLVVGFSGEVAKQLFEVIVIARQHDALRGALCPW
jgi:hypothetical protein